MFVNRVHKLSLEHMWIELLNYENNEQIVDNLNDRRQNHDIVVLRYSIHLLISNETIQLTFAG